MTSLGKGALTLQGSAADGTASHMLQFTQDIDYFAIVFITLSPLHPQKTPTSSMDAVFLIMDVFLVGQRQFACNGLKMRTQLLCL